MANAVKLHNVTARFTTPRQDSFTAVNKVSLTVEQGALESWGIPVRGSPRLYGQLIFFNAHHPGRCRLETPFYIMTSAN